MSATSQLTQARGGSPYSRAWRWLVAAVGVAWVVGLAMHLSSPSTEQAYASPVAAVVHGEHVGHAGQVPMASDSTCVGCLGEHETGWALACSALLVIAVLAFARGMRRPPLALMASAPCSSVSPSLNYRPCRPNLVALGVSRT